MATSLASILNLFSTPPGDLVFHLFTSLTLALTTGFLIIGRQKSVAVGQSRRLLIGCSILFIIQLGLFALYFVNKTSSFVNANFFPIFERLAAPLTIIGLAWAFLDNTQRKYPTILYGILSLLLIVLALGAVFSKSLFLKSSLFILFSIDITWQLIALALISISLVLALAIRPVMIKVLTPLLLLLAGGHIFQILLIYDLQGQMGAVRLSQMLSFAWLLIAVIYYSSEQNAVKPCRETSRATNLSAQKPILFKSGAVSQKKPPARRYSRIVGLGQPKKFEQTVQGDEMRVDTKPALVNLLLQINTAKTKTEKYQTIAQALSLGVMADICFLVSIPKNSEKFHILGGYDLIRETILKADTLAREDLPNVIAAWNTGKILNLSYDDTDLRDAQTLAMLLNYHAIGDLLAYPLGLPESPLEGGVFFLSPYTGKRWDDKTLQLMGQIHQALSMVLFAPDALEEASFTSSQAKTKVNELTLATEKLYAALTKKEAQIQEKDTLIKGLKAKFQIDRMETMTQMEQLQQKIADLDAQIANQSDFSSELEQFQKENRQLITEREQLQQELNRTKNMLRTLQTETGQTGPIRLSLENQVISLDSIAANARLRVASYLQEHHIDLETNNPDGRLMIKTDPELLQTALFELLKNAILSSDHGGTIRLEQKLSLEMGMLTVQITDFGEGLTQAEQAALFSAQHESIPGIGSVQAVRNAIRAIRVLNGKIWLKSKKISYTTFRLQIPVRIID